MVKSCCAFNCKSTSRHKNKTPGVRFHQFPLKNPELLLKWIDAIKRKNFFPGCSAVLCSLHFLPVDYYPSLVSGKPMLKKDAVPSVFSFSKNLVKPEKQPRRIIRCEPMINNEVDDSNSVAVLTDSLNSKNVAVQTDLTCEKLKSTLQKLRRDKKVLQMRLLRRNERDIRLKNVELEETVPIPEDTEECTS